MMRLRTFSTSNGEAASSAALAVPTGYCSQLPLALLAEDFSEVRIWRGKRDPEGFPTEMSGVGHW